MQNARPNEIIMLGRLTEKSQAGSVISPEGISFTLCAGNHGYAMGYIIEKVRVEDDGCSTGKNIVAEGTRR